MTYAELAARILVPVGDREIVDLAHAKGVQVWVWTLDDPHIARAMALLGVNAIKTDRPSLLLELFAR